VTPQESHDRNDPDTRKMSKLTDTAIAKAVRTLAVTGGRRDMSDPDCRGLVLRLTAAGSQARVLQCRDREGRKRRFPLGSYHTMGLSAARTAARLLHAKVKQDGVDPIAQRRRERAIGNDAKQGVGTLAALISQYGEKQGKEKRSWPESKRRIETVFKRYLTRPLASLTATDLQKTADDYPAQQSAAAAVRYIRPVLKWGAARGDVGRDVALVTPPATVRRRDRMLSREELAALLPVLEASERPYAAALRFMLLTLTRREEAAGARWADVNLDSGMWTISRTKNGQPHVVPLPRQAISLLYALRPEGARSDDLIFATRTGKRLGNWDRETKALQVESKTEGWTRHDLRRTGATMLGDMGELPDIIEAALNHVAIRNTLAATYNRSRYRPQVAIALQRLADALDGITAGGAEVIPMRKSA
jgi:integrase